jgi:hypothetical protein
MILSRHERFFLWLTLVLLLFIGAWELGHDTLSDVLYLTAPTPVPTATAVPWPYYPYP